MDAPTEAMNVIGGLDAPAQDNVPQTRPAGRPHLWRRAAAHWPLAFICLGAALSVVWSLGLLFAFYRLLAWLMG